MKQFKSGASRVQAMAFYHSIPPSVLRRMALIHTEGAYKYGGYNWQKGMPYSEVYNHLMDHLQKWIAGDASEDHLAKVIWGVTVLMYYEEVGFNSTLDDIRNHHLRTRVEKLPRGFKQLWKSTPKPEGSSRQGV